MKAVFYYLLFTEIFTMSSSAEIDCICQNTFCQVTPGRCKAIRGCFSSMKPDDKKGYIAEKGCITNDAHFEVLCVNKPYPVICCKENMCNYRNATPSNSYPSEQTINSTEASSTDTFSIPFITAGVLGILAVIIILVCLCHWCSHYSNKLPPVDVESNGNWCVAAGETLRNLLEHSCTSGSGLPPLVQRTIAKEVTLVTLVGEGKFGKVWHSRWRGEDVAVKKFNSNCEASWQRETEIYQIALLRHESILGFIASDVISKNQQTQMYLITEYHPHGSLHDFLHCHSFSKKSMILLVLTASTGLTHLHTEIQGTRGKPAIAHRDIKSKNILVKENLTCCIADFGLAVTCSPATEDIDINPDKRVGTRRYMAPEVLDNTPSSRHFAAFKKADIYSFGLVLWEITRRCISDETGLCDDYQEPYFDMLPGDPSSDEVKNVVATEKRRPSIPNRWYRDECLQTMAKLITECWAHHPDARLTAMRVQKTVRKLKNYMDVIDLQPYDEENYSYCVGVTTAEQETAM